MMAHKEETPRKQGGNTPTDTECTVTTGMCSMLHKLAWILWGEDEEPVNTGDKRDRKNRTHEKRFSKKFIRITCAIGVLFLGLFIAGSMKLLGIGPSVKLPGFTYLKVSNVKELKAAMSKSGPRIVYCNNVKLSVEHQRIASIAVKALPPWINKFALDCSAKLPSGRTAYQRFELDPASTLMFVQAHGKKAVPLTEHIIGDPHHFIQRVINTASYVLKRVEDPAAFNRHNNERMLLLVTDGRKFNPYNADHTMAVSRVIDTDRLYNMSTWVVNDTLHELKFTDEVTSKGDGFTMYCLVPYDGKYLVGTSTAAPFGKGMETFMRLCSKVSERKARSS
ncbi:pb-reticulocyte binding protein, putative [Babesia ovis]|uniref:Pb-reticulocyte binding protein, putative n=1 Tax=Babesia ovis TaxID=5869 RepID=A0A9W5WV11_BABOV|nr:pb-reticulocyte binding protein, putative [Babesia ovis]